MPLIQASFKTLVLAGCVAVVSLPLHAQAAQLNSTPATVVLTATLAESLTVSATPAAATFNLNGGTTAASTAPVAITTTWVLGPGRANVILDAYFSSATAALSSATTPTTTIPSSEVSGQMTTGSIANFTPFTQATAASSTASGLTLFTQSLSATNRAATRTDNLNLQIDLTNQAQLPAGVYTGQLTIQAVAL